MLQIFLQWVIPFVCGGLASALIAVIKIRSKQERAERQGICALLRAEIIRQHDKWEERGYCPIYAKRALAETYNAYHALGGNDVATDLYNKTLALPDKPKEDDDADSN